MGTDTFLTIVQQETVPAIIIAAAMYQSAGGAVLLVVHTGDHGLSSMGITEYVLIGQSGTMAVDEQYGGREARKRHFDELREAEGMDAFYAALDEERAEIERLGSDPARQADYIRKRECKPI